VIPPLSGRWGILGAAYADCVAVLLLTVTLGATAWSATRQVGLPVLKTAAVPLAAALSSGFLAFIFTRSIQSDALQFSFGVCLTTLGYVLMIAVLGGRARLVDLANTMRIVVRRSPLPAASQM